MRWWKKKPKVRVTHVMLGTIVTGATAKRFLTAIKPITAADAIAGLIRHVVDGEIILNYEEDKDV